MQLIIVEQFIANGQIKPFLSLSQVIAQKIVLTLHHSTLFRINGNFSWFVFIHSVLVMSSLSILIKLKLHTKSKDKKNYSIIIM